MKPVALAWATLTLVLAARGPTAAQAYPVEVRNCFETARFDAAPKRALVNDTNMVQTILDLGLAEPEVAETPLSTDSPSREDLIRREAYAIYERRGFAPGDETEDWVAAEKEVDRQLGGQN